MKDVVARILHLEDGDDDAYFVEHALRGDSILGELRRVDNAEDFRAALRDFEPDVILADYQLPDMDGMEALAMSVELRPDTPFIFVTGYLGEDVAVGTFKEGATDYVLKDHLTRLPSAVRRVLREAGEREKLAIAQASLVREEKRAEEDLRQSVAALQRSDDERRRLLDRMFAVQEEERHKIAGDIHDDSVQVMAAAALRLDMLRTKVKDPEQLTMIDRLTTTVRTSIDRLRRLMFELRPPALDREGLAAAVQTYLGRVEEESELETELENLLTEEPPERVRLVLYRVVQEAMTNARKHSEAKLVSVRLEEKDDSVVATITDNGRGFEMGDSIESPPGHLGISSMRERTTQAGGRLSLRTAPGEGTTVEVRLPLHANVDMPPLAA